MFLAQTALRTQTALRPGLLRAGWTASPLRMFSVTANHFGPSSNNNNNNSNSSSKSKANTRKSAIDQEAAKARAQRNQQQQLNGRSGQQQPQMEFANNYERWRAKIEEQKAHRKESALLKKDTSWLTPIARKLLPKSFLFPTRKLLAKRKANKLAKKAVARVQYRPEPFEDTEVVHNNVLEHVSPVRALAYAKGSKPKAEKTAKK